MLYAAKNLDFEKAAALSDELKKLRESILFEGGLGSAEWYLLGEKTLEHKLRKNTKLQSIKAVDIDKAIQMLKKYVDDQGINPLLSALETLKTEPQSEALQTQVINAFNALNHLQGAALTYAPYLSIFVSDDPFND